MNSNLNQSDCFEVLVPFVDDLHFSDCRLDWATELCGYSPKVVVLVQHLEQRNSDLVVEYSFKEEHHAVLFALKYS